MISQTGKAEATFQETVQKAANLLTQTEIKIAVSTLQTINNKNLEAIKFLRAQHWPFAKAVAAVKIAAQKIKKAAQT